ncbi:hypothetical protein EVAR_104002_1 [Eumeta japonica]|uniref:Uncharacterized protein n=1 Tax=Eumeta variegata TaxID=151549 RepID=A0A4C1XZQ0_EUMVA|nr:hypothetical protein EVAR_104002_1 [Eumeta japonica]
MNGSAAPPARAPRPAPRRPDAPRDSIFQFVRVKDERCTQCEKWNIRYWTAITLRDGTEVRRGGCGECAIRSFIFDRRSFPMKPARTHRAVPTIRQSVGAGAARDRSLERRSIVTCGFNLTSTEPAPPAPRRAPPALN